MTTNTAADVLRQAREALAALYTFADARECRHENTHRGGIIWTICDDCRRQWADDRNPFKPWTKPAEFRAAEAALSAIDALPQQDAQHSAPSGEPAAKPCEWTNCPTRVGNVCCNDRATTAPAPLPADLVRDAWRRAFGLPSPQPLVPDWPLRSKVADLLHLLEFSSISTATGSDDAQARKAMAELKRALAAPLMAGGLTPQPSDPMDWPLPCDVKVGHGTMRKGVRLGTLVSRMKVLYEMATGEKADKVAALTGAERQDRMTQFQADLAAGCKPVARGLSEWAIGPDGKPEDMGFAAPQAATASVAGPQDTGWLVEQFGADGNSAGAYMLDQGALTITADVNAARRFRRMRTAMFRADDMKQQHGGDWRAAQHAWIGAAPQAAPVPAPSDGAIYSAVSEATSPEWHAGFRAGMSAGAACAQASTAAAAPEPVGWRPNIVCTPPQAFNAGKPDQRSIDYWNAHGCGIEYAYSATHPAPAVAATVRGLTDEQAQALWVGATIERTDMRSVYLRGLRDGERAHGIATPAAPKEPGHGQAMQERVPSDDRAWLVEWRFNGVQWLYLTGTRFSFTADLNKALRFARRVDAESAMSWVAGVDRGRGLRPTGEMLVTEHVWCDPATPAAPKE